MNEDLSNFWQNGQAGWQQPTPPQQPPRAQHHRPYGFALDPQQPQQPMQQPLPPQMRESVMGGGPTAPVIDPLVVALGALATAGVTLGGLYLAISQSPSREASAVASFAVIAVIGVAIWQFGRARAGLFPAMMIALLLSSAVVLGTAGARTAATDRQVNDALPTIEQSGDAMEKPSSDAMMAKEDGAMVKDDAMAKDDAMMAKEDGAMVKEDAMAKDQGTGAAALLSSGSFQTVEHTTKGTAQAVSLDDGTRQLILRDFKTDAGPDLQVWLAAGNPTTDDGVKDVVKLGGLKGTSGNQVYRIPAGTDLERYDTVVIWCRIASVTFGRAQLV
jgi:hypothetical protein